MTSAHDSELFKRTFRPQKIENVCVLAFVEDFNPDDADALSLLNDGVESMVRAGTGGFVFT